MSAVRYGIAEWFGVPFDQLDHLRKIEFTRAKLKQMPCPFAKDSSCNKKGGVCSFRKYARDSAGGVGAVSDSPIVSLCPNRFLENSEVHTWIGSELLGTDRPAIATEIPFLIGERKSGEDDRRLEAVGRIDAVLANPEVRPMEWCALEIQAVYFSGLSMASEFAYIRDEGGDGVHWPQAIRRPDFRSSGPKRLMPQLQIKVPTIRRSIIHRTPTSSGLSWNFWMRRTASISHAIGSFAQPSTEPSKD
jgi:hypothetical protein